MSFAQDEVLDLAAEYNKIKKGVTKLEEKKRRILSEIYNIEKETNKLVLEKNDIDEKKLKLDGQLSQTSKKIVSLQNEIQTLLPDLVERVGFAEHVNDLPWFYTFLTSQSLSQLDRTLTTAAHINEQQSETVLRFLDLIKELELNQKELNKVAVEIVSTQKSLKAKELQIEKRQVEKKKYLGSLESQLNRKKIDLKTVKGRGRRALNNSIFKDMEILFGSGFFDKKGQLPHPVQSSISHGYGLNKGLLSQSIQLIHKGYFYQTLWPKEVVAVASGRVRHSGQVPGHGYVVIIDHGSRYYTTYANLGETRVRVGEEIKSGSLLGLTGHDHLQMGPGIYFEIRHFSQPQNPETWLQKPKEQLATI